MKRYLRIVWVRVELNTPDHNSAENIRRFGGVDGNIRWITRSICQYTSSRLAGLIAGLSASISMTLAVRGCFGFI